MSSEARSKSGEVFIVGLAEVAVSQDPNLSLRTCPLGACIGIAIYDPVAKVGGVLHSLLPDSRIDVKRAADRPGMFIDTGLAELLKRALGQGATRENLLIFAAGGAQIIDETTSFNIGKRNHMVMRKILWKAGVMVHHEDVGGTVPRTARLEIGTGRVFVSFGREQREIQLIENERRIANNGL